MSLLTLALGTLTLVALVMSVAGNAAVGLRVGSPAPDLRLVTLNGTLVNLQELRGQPVVLYFFATWCPSCQFDLPMLDAAHDQHAGQGLVVLLVNVGNAPEHVQAFVEGWGFRGEVALDPDGTTARRYDVQMLPTTFFFARDKVLLARHSGALTNPMLDDALARLLAGRGMGWTGRGAGGTLKARAAAYSVRVTTGGALSSPVASRDALTQWPSTTTMP